jgi:hypothetical protein
MVEEAPELGPHVPLDVPSERKVAMRTAQPVLQLALYASACCTDEVLFQVNDVFSRCPKCERLCFWELVERVVSWQDLDKLELEAA